MQTKHYGVTVDLEVAITGVFLTREVDWVEDDLFRAGIDLAWEEHIETCENAYHDECWGEEDGNVHIIGYKEDADGKYTEDPDAEYSAIINRDSGYSQVTKSKWGIKCALCSPCYPGQGDVDTAGDFTAYAFPPDLFDSESGFERVSDIFILEKRNV